MSAIGKSLSRIGLGGEAKVEVPFHGQVSSIDLRLPGDLDPARRVGDGTGTSIVQAVLNWYINAFPEAQLEVTAPDTETGLRLAVEDHELVELLENPNPYYGGDELFAGCIVSDIVDGNSYLLKLRNNSGRLAELYWVSHLMVEPRPGQGPTGEFIKHYEYNVSGSRYEIPPSEIVHLRHGMDPANPRKGMSRLKGQLREVMTDEEAARFTTALVLNMGVPGLVVSPKTGEDGANDVDEPTAMLVKTKLDQGVGSSNRGRSVVLSGAVDIKEFGFSPEQMDLSSVRGVPEERISAALSVPAAVVGLGTGLSQTKVGATMKELREMAAEQGLVPLWRRFGKGLHRQLTYEYQTSGSRYVLGFNTDDVRVLQEDKQLKHERTREDYKASIIDGATAQGTLGYEVDESRRTYLQSGLLVERPVGEEPATTEAKNWEMKLTADQRGGLAFVKYTDRGMIPIERNYAAALEKAFDDIGKAAAASFLANVSAADWAALDDDIKASKVMELLDADISDSKVSKKDAQEAARYRRIANKMMSGIDEVKFSVATISNGAYEQSAELVVTGYKDAFNISLTIGERDIVAEEILKAGGKRVGLVDLSAQSRDAIFRGLAESKELGLGMPQTARNIREHVAAGPYPHAGPAYRAETIARTEARWAMNRSVAEVGKVAGFTKYVAFDDRIGFGDPDCVARDGEESDYAGMVGADDHPRGTLSWSPVPRSGPSAGQIAKRNVG